MDVFVINGSIDFEQLTGKVRLEATNGYLKGSVDSTKGMKLSVTNGSVDLDVDSAFTGSVNAQVVDGKILREDIDFIQISEDKNNLRGIIGSVHSGMPELTIEVVNGKIKLHGEGSKE